MSTGWEQVNYTYYYFNRSGRMKTGWLDDMGTWYYLNHKGMMVTGWHQLDGSWYYFYGNGMMATNTTIDGWHIGSNGIATYISNGGNSGLSDNSTVFITPGGKSYHSSKNCATLKNSKTILSMTLREAKNKGKSDPCNVCVR
ncbi:hypothetical protein [Paeniclostridium hominis]